jgi:serine/threonine protein kinase
MEFCPEGNLHQKIVKARSAAVERCETYKAPAQAPRWLAHIFLGLEHVHLQLHMLFRDLKPGNVVFSADGCAKLTDFGLSRFGLESDGNWTFGFPAGSPGYASPEVMLGEEYDARADLYSFGVLMWVLLTGGVTDRDAEDPCPPMTGIEEDWKVLAKCLDDPASHNAQSLDESALSLVRSLTDESAAARMYHDGVRGHDFFANLSLPEPIDRDKQDAKKASRARVVAP